MHSSFETVATVTGASADASAAPPLLDELLDEPLLDEVEAGSVEPHPATASATQADVRLATVTATALNDVERSVMTDRLKPAARSVNLKPSVTTIAPT